MPVIENFDGAVRWSQVPGYGGDYLVSDEGDVVSRKHGTAKKLKPNHSQHGYMRVNLCASGKCRLHYVHELVAAAFIGPRPLGHQVRHLNSDGTDNRACNLSYGSQAENEADKIAVGRSNAGSRHGMSKLTEDQVKEIRSGLSSGRPGVEIAAQFGVHPNTISHIKKNRTWRKADASS